MPSFMSHFHLQNPPPHFLIFPHVEIYAVMFHPAPWNAPKWSLSPFAPARQFLHTLTNFFLISVECHLFLVHSLALDSFRYNVALPLCSLHRSIDLTAFSGWACFPSPPWSILSAHRTQSHLRTRSKPPTSPSTTPFVARHFLTAACPSQFMLLHIDGYSSQNVAWRSDTANVLPVNWSPL